MGVKYLRKHLQPYSEDTVIGRSGPIEQLVSTFGEYPIEQVTGVFDEYSLNGSELSDDEDSSMQDWPSPFKNLVFDGPCLAYFIYSRLLSQQSVYLREIDGPPSYAMINEAILGFLGQLEKCGLKMWLFLVHTTLTFTNRSS